MTEHDYYNALDASYSPSTRTFDPFRPAIELDGVRVNLDADECGFVVLGGPVACENCEESVAAFEPTYRPFTPGPSGARCPHCMATFPLLEAR